MTVRRSSGEQLRKLAQINVISVFEPSLADLVLFNVMIATEADGPSVRRFERHPTVSIAADVGALDRAPQTARYAAVVPAHPGTMGWALTALRLASLLPLKPVR